MIGKGTIGSGGGAIVVVAIDVGVVRRGGHVSAVSMLMRISVAQSAVGILMDEVPMELLVMVA